MQDELMDIEVRITRYGNAEGRGEGRRAEERRETGQQMDSGEGGRGVVVLGEEG